MRDGGESLLVGVVKSANFGQVVMTHAFNPSPLEAEVYQDGLQNEFQDSQGCTEKLSRKTKKQKFKLYSWTDLHQNARSNIFYL